MGMGVQWIEWNRRPDRTTDTQGPQIAKRHRTRVRRLLRLAYLAPDIVESIAEGRSRGLALERLFGPVPFAWSEQRHRFGRPRRIDDRREVLSPLVESEVS